MRVVRGKAQVGNKFGKWTVIERSGPSIDGKCLCQCDCGNSGRVTDYDLSTGKSTQCRKCAVNKPYSELGKRLVHIPKDIIEKVRAAAQNAIGRCTDSTHQRYAEWGGRGIKVCFPDKESFVEYLLTLPGYDNPSLVIDRIDNDKHYETGNLRWATRSESQQNQRNQGGDHGYYMKHGFARCFKRLHDKGISFKEISGLYCANPSTIRNCVRKLEARRALNSRNL